MCQFLISHPFVSVAIAASIVSFGKWIVDSF